jgi:DNA recombination protein RmuC
MNLMYISIALSAGTALILLFSFIRQLFSGTRAEKASLRVSEQMSHLTKENQLNDQQLRENLLVNFNTLQQVILEKLSASRLEQTQQSLESLKLLHETLQKSVHENRQQVKEALNDYGKEMGTRVDKLTHTTESKLKEINTQVEKRLTEGFEKTNETFGDVIKRLAMIDAAQKQISELSNNVVNLNEILNDKRSRGTFGEVQLSALIRNMIPEQHFSFQHLLSNNKRPDCMLFLPEPTGNIAIDAKFPLENYKLIIDSSLSDTEKQQALKQFKIDIRKHISDIAEKYIIPGETSDGAVMFIPAESVFAEIHAHHSDLVETAQQAKIWMVSPTTMMAILTTARAVLKDAATRKQVHEIQKHLRMLADDFERFQMRMDNLSKRIAQAHTDVEQIHISSRKITQRFVQIDKAEFDNITLDGPITPAEAVGE